MSVWLLGFGWNWLLVPVAVWFLRGLWVATQRPRLRLVSISKVSETHKLISVKRQQLLPPWLVVEETYLLVHKVRDPEYTFLERYLTPEVYRESDGSKAPWDIVTALVGLCVVQQAREAETEELSK